MSILRVFSNEISIYISDVWGKQFALHNVGGLHPITWMPELNRKTSKREFFSRLPLYFICTIHSPECPACRPTLYILNWTASIIAWANSLLKISFYIWIHPIGSVSLEKADLIHKNNQIFWLIFIGHIFFFPIFSWKWWSPGNGGISEITNSCFVLPFHII